MISLKNASILFLKILGIDVKKIQRECGEKAFRPKALVVASLAGCALSSHFSSLFKTYMIKIDL